MTEADSKRVFGSGLFDRPQIAPATHIGSTWQGCTADEPSLHTSAVPDAIARTFITPAENSKIGSNSDAAVCQQLGTRTMRTGRFLSRSAGVTRAVSGVAGILIAGRAIQREFATPAALQENAHTAKQTIGPAEDEGRIKRLSWGSIEDGPPSRHDAIVR